MLAELHEAYGVPADEKAAIELLPTRMRDIYPTEWGEQVFANLRRQVQVAEQVGLVKAVPAQPLWVDLGAAS